MNYHPLWDSFVVVLLTTLVVGLTPASSSLRPACLPILCALVWHCLLKCPEYIARSSWASSVGGYTLSSLLQYIDVAVLSRWSFELQGPENDLIKGTTHIAPSKAPTRPQAKTSHGFEIIDRFKFGLWVFCSWRFVNTPFQVRNILRLDDSLSQSRLRFLLHMGVTIIVCYLILDVMGSSSDSDIADKFYSSDKIGLLCRIQEVSLEELVMRFFAALALGASLVSVQRGVYCILAFISVAMGLHSPADWPPFNGPLSAISNLRSFWRYNSLFHQCVSGLTNDSLASFGIKSIHIGSSSYLITYYMMCYGSKEVLKQHDIYDHGLYSSYLDSCTSASTYPLVCDIVDSGYISLS